MNKHIVLNLALIGLIISSCAMSGSNKSSPPDAPPETPNASAVRLTQENPPDASPELTQAQRERESLSYGVGYYLGLEVREGMRMDGIEASLEQLRDGFGDGLSEAAPDIPQDELDAIMYAVHREMQKRMVARMLADDPEFRALSIGNHEHSLAYLSEHAHDEGVITLDNGIEYKILNAGPTPGRGRKPTRDDTIVASYRGTLYDGTPVQSGDREELPIRRAVEGAQQILTMMREGETWQVTLPPELGYGAAGDPPLIGPNEVLLFEVTLHEVTSGK